MARIECHRAAFVLARSGSMGLKDKNIKELCGKPLIAWTIEAALESNCFDKVLVSTDSCEYGDIARYWGADVLYRADHLASCSATSFDVIQDLLENYVWPKEFFALLQPTSPLRTSGQIKEAIERFRSSADRYDFLASVSEATHPSDLVHPLSPSGDLSLFNADYSSYRRQSTKDFSPNGAIFVAKPDKYLVQKHFFGPRSIAFVMNKESSIDIDDSLDFSLAEICMKRKLAEG